MIHEGFTKVKDKRRDTSKIIIVVFPPAVGDKKRTKKWGGCMGKGTAMGLSKVTICGTKEEREKTGEEENMDGSVNLRVKDTRQQLIPVGTKRRINK